MIGDPRPDIFEVSRRLRCDMKQHRRSDTVSLSRSFCFGGTIIVLQIGSLGAANSEMRIPHAGCHKLESSCGVNYLNLTCALSALMDIPFHEDSTCDGSFDSK